MVRNIKDLAKVCLEIIYKTKYLDTNTKEIKYLKVDDDKHVQIGVTTFKYL